MNKKQLYESIMQNIQKSILEALEDIEFNGKHLKYNTKTGKYENIVDAADDNMPIQYRKTKINNTVILDPVQETIVSFKHKDDIMNFLNNATQKIIETNGEYFQEFIDLLVKILTALNISPNNIKFQFLDKYDGTSYDVDEKWQFVKTGQEYTTGYDGGDYSYRKNCQTHNAEHNLFTYVYRSGTNYSHNFYGHPKYEHTVAEDNQLKKDMVRICKKDWFKNYLCKLIPDILESRVTYMKEHNLFDDKNASNLYVKYGVDKKPSDWFKWASVYIPKYINANGNLKYSCAGWYGGIDNIFYDKRGNLIVSTYMTNDHSDSCGIEVSFSEFNKQKELHYRDSDYGMLTLGKPYICDITVSDKCEIYEKLFNKIKKQIELGEIK